MTTVMHYAVDPPRTGRDGWPTVVVACGAAYEGLHASGSRDATTCRDCIDMIDSGRLDAAVASVEAWEDARVAALRSLRWRFTVKAVLYGVAIAALMLFIVWSVVWR